ncbi:tumor necrosis factor ligand superfamily member 9 [Talpa occidentalis]|uniref:tumor necrosis factor ligand superfamily member 9 n=1 Tax=Talpa occidentalis TaxID=50954 RepID=UPI00188F34BD|nr:tumor necrosis factor ligand superfamily member 9 [Talpa occidentalis]
MPCPAKAARDPEAQRPPEPSGRACHPLPWALSAALLLLSGTGAAFVACTWIWPRDPAEPRRDPTPSPTRPEVPEAQPGPCARLDSSQGLFVQLVLKDVQLAEGPLSWWSSPGMEGVFLSPGLRYEEEPRQLVVQESGRYHVYLHLELQRVVMVREDSASRSGSVSASLQLQTPDFQKEALPLTLTLPPLSWANSTAAFQSGQLDLVAGQRLSVHLKASEQKAYSHWQLSRKTVLGLFRVTTNVPPERLSQQST